MSPIEALVDKIVHSDYDWMAHHDLYWLKQKITQALQAERRKLIDTIEAMWCDGHDPDEKAERIVKWCRTQAEKERL